MAAEGIGFLEFWTSILAAPPPISYVSWSIVLLEVLFMVAAAVFVIRWVATHR